MRSSMREFLAFLLGAAIPTACILLLRGGGGGGVISSSWHAPAAPGDELPGMLGRAAMEGHNTVLMTFANKAWAAPGSLLDLFLESFREGDKTEPLLKHLVIVAVDADALRRCQEVHPLCYPLDAGGGGGVNFTAEKEFMSKGYLEMMWARNKFQTRVLELGYSFVFTDMDIVWFRNPLLRIPVAADVAISCDQFYGDDPYDVWKNANGGFLYARPSNRTVAFFKGWYDARTAHPGQHDQDVFDKVKHDLSLRHGVAVHLVDTAHFGGSCQPKKDFRQLCTFHGNCLKGLAMKLDVLRKLLDEWKQFKISGRQQRENNNTVVPFQNEHKW